jgi:hypothetical protein
MVGRDKRGWVVKPAFYTKVSQYIHSYILRKPSNLRNHEPLRVGINHSRDICNVKVDSRQVESLWTVDSLEKHTYVVQHEAAVSPRATKKILKI